MSEGREDPSESVVILQKGLPPSRFQLRFFWIWLVGIETPSHLFQDLTFLARLISLPGG